MGAARHALASALAATALLAAGSAAAGVRPDLAKPQRIVSMNLCADMLVLQLVPKSRIAAVTYLARNGARDFFPGADAGVAINHGTAEDIINLRPDLIVGDTFSSPLTRRLAARVGAPLIEVRDATTFPDIRRNLRQVGAAVGEPERAEALVRRMDAALAELAAKPAKPPVRVIAWSGGDSVPGQATLSDQVFRAAGAMNVAAPAGGGYANLGVEQVLAARPDALLHAAGPSARPSLRAEAGGHLALRRLYEGRRIAYSEVATTCGLPQSAESARDLRRALDALPSREPRR